MIEISNLLHRLNKVKKNGSGWQALCPAHEDMNPSLSISEGNDGRVLLYCHAGCTFDSVANVLGYAAKDLMPDNSDSGNGRLKQMKSSNIYDYKDESGRLLYQILKYENPKSFRVRRPDGNGGSVWSLNGTSRVLYRLPELINSNSQEVLMTEGEKDCDCAISHGFTAVTNAFGADCWQSDYNVYLEGKEVVIVQDNDEAGAERTRTLLENLTGVASSIKIIDFSSILPFKGADLFDYFKEHTSEDLRKLIDTTPQIQRATRSEFACESEGTINRAVKGMTEQYKPKQNDNNSKTKISPVCSDLLDLHLSDAGNAEALVKLYSRKLRFDHTSKQWFIWNGNTWEKDEKGNTKIYALRTARERLRSAADIEDKGKRKSLVNWCFQSESNFRINATLSIASTLEPLAVIKSEFDSDPMLLGCLNGVVNLSTGEFQEGNPEDMISLSTHIQFDESAKAPRWDRFLSEIFSQNEELINFVHRFVGYSLTGLTNEQIFAMLVGTGENGKSVFLAAVKNILGDYAANTPFSTFLSFKYDGNKISNEMAALAGKRFVTASEIKENMILNEGTIKAATGDDEITARFLKKNSFTFTPAFKLALCVNHKPKILDTTHAFWRRIKVIPFERKFSGEKRDNKLLDKLKNEAPGMLNWAIQGCLKWQTEGLKSPDIITAATKEYRTEEDVFKQFIEDCTCRGESAKVESAKLWEAWKTWAEKNGEKSQTNTWLGRKMKDEDGIIKERATIGGKKKTVYQGIGLLEETYEG